MNKPAKTEVICRVRIKYLDYFMRNYLALLLSLFLYCSLSAQVLNKDSLLRLLTVAKEDTNKISLLFNIEKEYFFVNDFDSALYYNK